MSKKLKTGLEFKGKNGDRVIILKHIDLWDLVYFIDDVLFCNALSSTEFKQKYKPTGRINLTIKEIFKDKHFKGVENDTNKSAIKAIS